MHPNRAKILQTPLNNEFDTTVAWQARLAALLEVFGVFVAGTLLARWISRALNFGSGSLRSLAPGEQPDFFSLSGTAALNLLLRYGLIFILAFSIGWWHRRRRMAQYGVTMGGHSFDQHVAIGLLLFAAAGLPAILLKFLATVLPLGPTPAHWALIQDLSRPGIWLYLAVGSFGLVPIMEELLARGYIQTRLSEDFGAPAAILVTALFFTLSHNQYFIAGVVGPGMVVGLFVAALAIGYVRYRTGSVLPGIIAHACGNLPFRGWALPAVLTGMILVVILKRRAIFDYTSALLREIFVHAATPAVIQGLVIIVALVTIELLTPRFLPVLSVVALICALALELRDKLRKEQPINSQRRLQVTARENTIED